MAYKDVILADTPAHYWRLNEPQGTLFFDLMTPGFPLTALNGAFPGYTGIANDGGAVFFNGSNGTLRWTTNGHWAVPPFTVEFWVLVTALQAGAQGVFVSNNLDPATGWSVTQDTALKPFQAVASGGVYQSLTYPSALVTFVWHHVVAWFAATTYDMFVDNVAPAGPFAHGAMTQPNTGLYVGSYQGSANFLNGFMTEVAIYNYVLSGAQVAAHLAARERFDGPQPAAIAGQAALLTNLADILAAIRHTYQNQP